MAATTRRSQKRFSSGASPIRQSLLFFCALICCGATGLTAELAHYDLKVDLDPGDHLLQVKLRLAVPDDRIGEPIEFLLGASLEIEHSSVPIERLDDAGTAGFQGINGSSIQLAQRAGIHRYRATLPQDAAHIELRYAGEINSPLETQGEEYTRGFRETPGSIGKDGIYLAGSTLWYPYLGPHLVSFKVEAKVPAGWHLISQGNGSSNDAGVANWDSAGPVDEIYLVGGPLQRTADSAGAAVAEIYLREPDAKLSKKYLEATARYIEMYRGLIGPYPYGKFALVENFWETGYGMPSFTLLGSQIIRFPFILTSSYPHEILHNWWGNSVFVDYDTGNWAEGLTAYMADHLIKEQQGQGAEYRRDTLKKYRDFVSAAKDFPLSQFRSRHSAATEAVGYGKTLMGFHALRRMLGDDAFRKALQSFYRKHRGKKTSFSDVQAELEATSDQDLDRFFREWVQVTGAANLALADIRISRQGQSYLISGDLLQTQAQPAFALQVPVAVTTQDGLVTKTIETERTSTHFEIETQSAPLLLSVDPEFDLFRLLDARETAPSIGQVFGEPSIVAVLPSAAKKRTQKAYRELLQAWENPDQSLEVVMDDEIEELPEDRAVWLLGAENRVAKALFTGDTLADVVVKDSGVELPGGMVSFANNSTVIMTRHPGDATKAVGWITVNPFQAFVGMAGKLPHYGKYSYLAFAGEEPANFLKGEWAASDSPLRLDLRPPSQRRASVAPAKPPKRQALAEMPPLFSAERLEATVNWLAAEEREGRGLGTQGLEKSAQYIAEQFADIGLKPASEEEQYFQSFTVDVGPEGGPNKVHNLIGYLPGSDPRFAEQAVLITAHYDHLGYGWPDQRADSKAGALYAGADDNASGVAVLLELARNLANAGPPPRSIVFAALTSEEAGLLGSQYFVEHPRPVDLDGITSVINLDTVGRLGDQAISILATESASEWPHIFRGVSFTTGIPTRNVPGASQSSDQQSFINVGIPAVQIFTGAHLDYHRPGDTADKVDVPGMMRVAAVVKEAAVYLSERPEPLTVSGKGVSSNTATQTRDSAAGNRRRVSFGTIPDFAYQGEGVRVESVVPDSPAANAGILAGDIITAIDDQKIVDLSSFSETLKTFAPGDQVTASGERDGQIFQAELEFVAR